MSHRILVVSYYHPPAPDGGGSRWDSMARHLTALGHSVTVLAGDAWGGLSDDSAAGVVRVHDLRGARVIRLLLRRAPLLDDPSGVPVAHPSMPLLERALVPDPGVVGWLPTLTVTIRRLLAEQEFDCLVTTSPPESTHLVGLLLGRRRPPWIADFRDGWGFEPIRRRFPTAPQRALDSLLERRVAASAEVVVGATRPIADDLARRLGGHSTWVPNGWDPASAPPPASEGRRSETRERTLVHTGSLSGVWGRDPAPLFHALKAVRAEPDTPPLRIVHAGRLTPAERALIDASGVADAFVALGALERPEALAVQRSADALVLITSANSSEATGKLYEYLGSGRPIVALAEGNEAARIVCETRTGIAVRPRDVDAIAAVLRRVATGELERAYSPRALEQFTYPGPARRMAVLVEEAVRRRGR